jgi:hypothetical protein
VGGGGKNANDDMILAMRIFVVPLDGVFDTGLAPLQALINGGQIRCQREFAPAREDFLRLAAHCC